MNRDAGLTNGPNSSAGRVRGGKPVSDPRILVRDVVRDVVAEVAVDELPIVDGLFRFDDATVVRRLARHGSRRESLGFGLGEIAILVTPVVWLVVNEIATRIAGSMAEGITQRVKELARRVMRRRSEPVSLPPLTREQLVEVWQRVLEAAMERGLGDSRATMIADAVVARLALADPPTDRYPSSSGDADGGTESGSPQPG